MAGGGVMRTQIASMRATLTRLVKEGTPAFCFTGARLREAIESLDRATSYLLRALSANAPEDALAGATPYLRLFALAQGGTSLADAALAANALITSGDTDPAHPARIALCRFFAENLATGARGLEEAVTTGAGALKDAQIALAS
jgi:acyl-CoA dehydrogenase